MNETAPKATWDERWRPDPGSIEALAAIAPSTRLTIVKRGPDSVETIRYPAVVVEGSAPDPWFEVVTTWGHDRYEVSGLIFERGDTFREFFSAEHPFNAFAVVSPDGEFRGWYGNVTYPAFVLPETEPPTLVWHDLYLDVVILPDGAAYLLDDDELEESGMLRTHPAFAAAIVQARRDLIATIPTLIR
jgi:hypothetical protein